MNRMLFEKALAGLRKTDCRISRQAWVDEDRDCPNFLEFEREPPGLGLILVTISPAKKAMRSKILERNGVNSIYSVQGATKNFQGVIQSRWVPARDDFLCADWKFLVGKDRRAAVVQFKKKGDL